MGPKQMKLFRTMNLIMFCALFVACNQTTISYNGSGDIKALKLARKTCFENTKVTMKTPYSERETCSVGKFKTCLYEKGFEEQKNGRLKVPFNSEEFCQAP